MIPFFPSKKLNIHLENKGKLKQTNGIYRLILFYANVFLKASFLWKASSNVSVAGVSAFVLVLDMR